MALRTAVRAGEGRLVMGALSTLFFFVAGHAILETARDALFLAKIPASNLPWMYVAIAALSLAISEGQRRLGSARRSPAWALRASLVAVAAVTATIGRGLPSLGTAGLYGLYLWSAIASTLVLVHFWTVVGGMLSVTQAKRLFGIVGAGSVLGAIAGSGIATALLQSVQPSALVLLSAGSFGLAAVTSLAFGAQGVAAAAVIPGDSVPPSVASPNASTIPPPKIAAPKTSLAADLRYVLDKPYPRRVAILLVMAAATFTVADYLFKSTVAARVPPAELGGYLATLYLVLNIASLAAQLFAVGPLLTILGPPRALSLLPALMGAGGAMLLVGGGLPAALVIRSADGSFRYSLHRTGTELLFVPLVEEARRRVKAVLDVLGQRGGQVAASVLILASGALAMPPWFLPLVHIALCCGWIHAARTLRAEYLDVFRGTLRHGEITHSAFPELDVASLETLFTALDSPRNEEVIAALDVLEREGKARVVPALVLYHPSEDVVERALEMFARVRRASVLPLLDAVLLRHASSRVRAAAAVARARISGDTKGLRDLEADESHAVRAAVFVARVAAGDLPRDEIEHGIQDLLATATSDDLVTLSRAVGQLGESTDLDEFLLRLLEQVDARVRDAAMRAMKARPRAEFIRPLIALLASDGSRRPAAAALGAHGPAVAAEAVAALDDETIAAVAKWQLPAVIANLEPETARDALVPMLENDDGMMRFRAIASLERLARRHPDLVLPRPPLEAGVASNIGRAYRYLERRVVLERGAATDPARKTDGHMILARALRDKQGSAIDRVFRLLNLLFPDDDVPRIARGLAVESRDKRASSIELLENLLKGPVRTAMIGLLDDLPDADRLATAGPFHKALDLDYDQVLERLLDSESESLRELCVYHIGELRLAALRSRVAALEPTGDVRLTLDLLDGVRSPLNVELAHAR